MSILRNFFLSSLLVSFNFTSIAWSWTKIETSSGNPPSTWELIKKSRMKQAESAKSVSVGRVLHFPKDRSLGRLMIQDSNVVRDIKTFHYWTMAGDTEWEYLGNAQGDVKIPSDKKVYLILDSWTWQNPSNLLVLKQLKPDDIDSLTLSPRWSSGGKSPRDEYMPYISQLTGLNTLNLSDADVTYRGLKYLAELKLLERLYTPAGLTNDGLAEIARLSSLKALYIRNHNLTNIGLAHLSKLPLLEELDLAGMGKINNAGLTHLVNLPHLRYLLLQGDNFTDTGIAHLKNCNSLHILHFGFLNRITDTALIHISEMSQLERISFHWNENITDVGIIHLTKLKSLTMLDINHARITDEGLANLSKIQTLENLTLPNAGITDAGIGHIAKLHKLRYLWTGGSSSSPLTDKSLHYISELENLEELNIGGKGFTDKGIKEIAKLKKLRHLSIFTADQLTNNGLAELVDLESLTDFNLGSHTNVSISGLKSLNSLKKLKNLTMRDIRQDGSIMNISGLTDLEVLTLMLHKERKNNSLVSDSFKNEDWACFANLTKIKRLQITGMGISNEGLKYLFGMKNIEFLNIICPGEERITDEALKYTSGMHKLNRLYIKDGHFTDRALEYLNDLPALSWLELTSDYAFSTKAIRDFKQKNPNVTRLLLIP